MAMLAEPRRKQKLSVDPRNRQWSDDQNKFGQKMLEKMGWKSGKGLGANEDGKTEHIKVSLKNNTLGVGCSQSYEDNWIAHQDDFNDILANLNQDHGTEEEKKDADDEDDASRKSLEERSKKSKSRVHYKKFTRGKDLSRYGSTDINCILGVRSNKSASSTPQTQSVNNSDNEDTTEDDKTVEDSSHGFTTITQNTSIQDYFAKKMAELKKGKTITPQQNVENGSNDCEESIETDPNGEDVNVKIKDKKKKKKKDKKKRTDNNDNYHVQNSDQEITENSIELDDSKKKKQKREDILPSGELGDHNIRTNSDAEEVVPRKKCKNKRRKDDSDGEGQDCQELNDSSYSSSKKSKKKKRKNKNIE